MAVIGTQLPKANSSIASAVRAPGSNQEVVEIGFRHWMRLLMPSRDCLAGRTFALQDAFAEALAAAGKPASVALFSRWLTDGSVEFFALGDGVPEIARLLAIHGFAPGAPRDVQGLGLLCGERNAWRAIGR